MLRDPSLIPLSHQHHNGLALCVMTRRSLTADGTPANVAKLARRAVDRYELELANHFEIEEQVLFPACGPMPPIALLVAEHRAIEILIAQLRTAPTSALLERFCALNLLEELVLLAPDMRRQQRAKLLQQHARWRRAQLRDQALDHAVFRHQ